MIRNSESNAGGLRKRQRHAAATAGVRCGRIRRRVLEPRVVCSSPGPFTLVHPGVPYQNLKRRCLALVVSYQLLAI